MSEPSIMNIIRAADPGSELRVAGTAFADSMRALPIGDMFKSIATGVAGAQAELDQSAIKLLQAYAATNVKMWNATGEPTEVSMLALGLVPSFFTFNRVNIKLVMELSFHEDQTTAGSIGADGKYQAPPTTPAAQDPNAAGAGGAAGSATPAQPAAGSPGFAAGASVSVSYARKFAIDMSGLAEVNAEMVSVPAPTAVLESITKYLTKSTAN